MITEEIERRNMMFIEDFVLKYDLKYSLSDILGMSAVYITFEDEGLGFRVYANDLKNRKATVSENETVARPSKATKVNIYNFLKKRLDKASREDILSTRTEFILFVVYLKQLKLIRELNRSESNAEMAHIHDKFSILSEL